MTYPETVQQLKAELKGRDFLTVSEYTKEQLMDLIEFAIELKRMQKEGIPHRYLEGKTLAMIFEKSSTRTRVSFETGMFQLGGMAQFLNSNDLQLGNGETISDTAQVLARYVDAIMIRTFGHEIVEEMADNSSVPVINGLTDSAHPCQILTDLMTIYEKKGSFDNLKLAYVGDGNNVSNSLIIGCAIMGIDCYIGVPEGYEVNEGILQKAKAVASESGSVVKQVNDPHEAVQDADIIYTDVWASMGFEAEMKERQKAFAPYQVNDELVGGAKDDYMFMHCLPARRNEEVTDSVIDSENSVVFDQAENRLHAQKAVLVALVD